MTNCLSEYVGDGSRESHTEFSDCVFEEGGEVLCLVSCLANEIVGREIAAIAELVETAEVVAGPKNVQEMVVLKGKVCAHRGAMV